MANYNNPFQRNSTITIRVMCAITFCFFSFCYLFFYQADILMVAQHVLSGGVTTYNRWVGAILLTMLLQLLQVGAYSVFRLNKRTHAVTYFPSMLLLTFVTDINADIYKSFSLGAWVWLMPLLLVLWVGVARLLKPFEPYEPEGSNGFFSRMAWANMAIMTVMMVGVALIGTGDDIFHYRAKMETCLIRGEYDKALAVGANAESNDAALTMLRVYALQRQGELGERLFEYPVTGSSNTILPTTDSVYFLVYPTDSIYRYLGAKPAHHMSVATYLRLLRDMPKSNTAAINDYVLCCNLIDRKLDDFVRNLYLQHRGDSMVLDSLPKHYREALVLYNHLRSVPLISYNDTVMNTDYEDMQALKRKYTAVMERKSQLRLQYGKTYWYYYLYR